MQCDGETPSLHCKTPSLHPHEPLGVVVEDILQLRIVQPALLKVYGRGGQPCLKCGRPLERITVGGRSSCFCPACQRKRPV